MIREISTPLTKDVISTLKSGDMINISGTIYTARDAAHKRIIQLMDEGLPLPFDLQDQIIYYVGPCPAPLGMPIGSCGPTTSGRMDLYTPRLISSGLAGMIGKGMRNQNVVDSLIQHKAVYLGAIGGVGALIAGTIVSQEIIGFPELGTEAVRKLVVKNFPTIVILDIHGNNLYEIGKSKYKIK